LPERSTKARLALAILAALPVPAVAQNSAPSADHIREAEKRARSVVSRMRQDEKTILTIGIMPTPSGADPIPVPDDVIQGAGYVAGIARLGIPALKESDASLGVAWASGLRKDGATALPSGLAMASSWNPDLLRRGGAMIGSEALPRVSTSCWRAVPT
jgi:beta-glucosidase